MSDSKSTTVGRASTWPEVKPLTSTHMLEALAAGVADFRTVPRFGLFFGGFYAVGGWLLIILLKYFNLPYLVYPLAMSFVLVAPFVATGLYDVSRRLERGETLTWGNVLTSVWGASGRDMGWMALVTGFTLIIWMDIAALLFFGFFGASGFTTPDPAGLVREILTTSSGWLFLAIGNAVGAAIALFVFSFSAVSFPMLYDREVDFVTAMVTSVRTVLANPGPMIAWALIIAFLIGISLLSGFLGLFVTLPVLGHATYHLYRRAVGAQPA